MTAVALGKCQAAMEVPLNKFFSIIVPVWNRQESIKRCLASVFSQDFQDYEVVVVDDASDDSSLAVIEGYNDSRMRVLTHKNNRGVCAARHTATNASVGKWILSLDSDWALRSGALKRLARLAHDAPPDVGVIGAYAKSDRDETYPGKPLPEGPFGFVEYLRWIDTSETTDFLSCRNRQVFEGLNWATDRRLELQFNLQVAKVWRSWVLPEVLATAYTDCENRYMTDLTARGVGRKIPRAPDEANSRQEILEEFGEDFKRHVPRVYLSMLIGAAHQHFCAGDRIRGLKYILLCLRENPWKLQLYARTLVGLMGPTMMTMLGRSISVQSFYRMVTK